MTPSFLLSFVFDFLILTSFTHGQAKSVRDSKSPQSSHRCLSSNPSKHHFLFGTKTTYTQAYKLIKKSSQSINDVVPSECEPVMFYLFKRHGIRYPDGDQIPEIQNTLEELKQKLLNFHSSHKTSSGQPGHPVLCDKDVKMIKKWQINMNQSDDNLISQTGASEISTIAKRFQKRYPSLLDPDQGISMDIAISDRIRTNQTGYHFVKQLYKDKNTEFTFDPSVSLEVTDFHSICVNNLKTQGVYLKSPTVYDDFMRSSTMTKVREAVSKRLGLDEPLAIGKLKMLYKGCSFGYAVNQDITWCSLFSDQELRIIEFAEDLDDYFGDAHGRDVNGKAPCIAMQDLLSQIESVVQLNKQSASTSSVKSPKAFLRFSHAGSFKQLLSHLGLFTSLHVNDFNVTTVHSCDSGSHDISSSNEWRSSLVSPFSTNIAFVLHKCPNLTATPDSSSPKSDYRILSLIQETPVRLKGCPSALCPLEQFTSLLHSKPYSCDLKQICHL